MNIMGHTSSPPPSNPVASGLLLLAEGLAIPIGECRPWSISLSVNLVMRTCILRPRSARRLLSIIMDVFLSDTCVAWPAQAACPTRIMTM